MKIGVLGANGNFALKRIKAIASGPDKIMAVCDQGFDRFEKSFPNLASVKKFTDYEELLKEDLEAVVVSVPDWLKKQIIPLAIKAGKHVLVEKPLSLTVQETKDYFSLARKNKVCLYAGYNLRYFPEVQALLHLIRQGHLGPIHFVRMFYGHGGIHSFLQNENWRISSESWGGAFIDMGTHLLNLAHEFMDHFESGFLDKQYIFSPNMEDHCTAILKNSQLTIELTASWTSWKSNFHLEVYGKEGVAEVEGLVKYAKYGQPGGFLRWGKKNPPHPFALKESLWSISQQTRADAEIPSTFSVDVEFLDEDWQTFSRAVQEKNFNTEAEEKMNLFVAEVMEKYYL
ncbi:MAG: Gfo/Idh/MocA family oxidoreductase [Deltaproteobacteria bacterium]|nr:Gfo/Idh/MocA family oxidoreductase [Deltaproteobacteria bacterium]